VTDLPLTPRGEVEPDLLARWLGLEPEAGRYFLLGTASLSAVGYEHDRSEPAIRLWNEIPHPFRISPAQMRGHRETARR